MIVLAAVVIALGALVYTLAVRREDLPEAAPVSPAAGLEEKKAAIYENLRDLQFEHRVGKLSEEDYQRVKLGLQRELAAVLAEIDRISGDAKVSEAAPAPVAHPAFLCPHCGASFTQPMKFCGNCGKPMNGGVK